MTEAGSERDTQGGSSRQWSTGRRGRDGGSGGGSGGGYGRGHWTAGVSRWGRLLLVQRVEGCFTAEGQAYGRCTNDSGSCTELCHGSASAWQAVQLEGAEMSLGSGRAPPPLSESGRGRGCGGDGVGYKTKGKQGQTEVAAQGRPCTAHIGDSE